MKRINTFLGGKKLSNTDDIVGSIGGPKAKLTLNNSWNGAAQCDFNNSYVTTKVSQMKKF